MFRAVTDNTSRMTRCIHRNTINRQTCRRMQEHRLSLKEIHPCPERLPKGHMRHTFKLIATLFLLMSFTFSGCGGGGGNGSPVPTYTVTYDGNQNTRGSVPADSTNYEQGATVTVLGNTGNLRRDGYAFAGWCVNTDGTGANYTQGQTFAMGTANVTLYAKWIAYSTGILDETFEDEGVVVTAVVPDIDIAQAMSIQADGKIVVAGYSYGSPNATLIRYNIDGSLDTTFGEDESVPGIVINTTAGITSRFQAMSIQEDGKIVVAGYINNGANFDFMCARYDTDGSLDESFDGDGIVTTNIGIGTNDSAYALSIQADDKIVVAGFTSTGGVNDFALVRYNADGSLDNSFHGDGIVTTDIGSDDDVAYALTIQPDNKIVAAGYSYNDPTNYDFALARYNADGSLDDSFDGDGVVTTSIDSDIDVAFSVSIQADNKLIVAGSSYNGVDDDFALARYNADGSLDDSFDGDGKVTTDIGSDTDAASALCIQEDGRIVVAGSSYNGADDDFALARYNTDGSLDNSFHGDGKVTTDIGSDNDVAYALCIQEDGKIVAAGSSSDDFAVVRYK